ncbi:MAG: hypothetical protein C4527_14270 [Candidatus Omnitrophota bacterium]|nr:MAG: hypothetical protein C4527_14270 [Candidatus Omnitrophota bacterium]
MSLLFEKAPICANAGVVAIHNATDKIRHVKNILFIVPLPFIPLICSIFPQKNLQKTTFLRFYEEINKNKFSSFELVKYEQS